MKNVLIGIPLVIATFILGRSKPSRGTPAPSATSKKDNWFRLGAIVDWVEKHPWIFTGSISLVVVLKVLRSVHGDIGVAAYMLAEGGLGIALSVLVMSVPLLAVGAYFGAIAALFNTYLERRWRTNKRVIGSWIGLLLAFAASWALAGFLLTSLISVGGLIGVGVSAAIPNSKIRPKRPTDHPGWEQYVVFCLVGASFGLGVSLFSDRHWMPAESLTVAVSGSPEEEKTKLAVTGYVIADNGVYVTYLGDESRALRHIKNVDLISRKPCSLPESSFFPRQIPILALDAQNGPPKTACSDLIEQTEARR